MPAGIALDILRMETNSSLDRNLLTYVRRRLPVWFDAHQRDLPWRKTADAYAIWVSEVMLQQTQVATVVPYYNHFLERFPTVHALAESSEQELLRIWEGLGYYRRARNMRRAAKIIMTEHGGQFPTDPKTVRRLPGFGRYTTGAVLSQAFDLRLPILEANSIRVLSRFFAIRGNPKTNPTQNRLWEVAEQLLPHRRVGAFNQSLMELGALICTIKNPNCLQCPIRRHCAAHKDELQQELPELPKAASIIEKDEMAFVVWRRNRLLIAQRPDNAQWAGMWEFPHGEWEHAHGADEQVRELLYELTSIRATAGQELTTIRHGITRYRIHMICREMDYRSGSFRSDFYPLGKWVKPCNLTDYPFSSPQRKLAEMVLKPRQLRLF